jgi:tRNA-modifying protein YgfZ
MTARFSFHNQAVWSKAHVYGIIIAKGNDSLNLLHRISTNNCNTLQALEGTQTVLTNEKGRIIDIISIIQCPDFIMLVTSYGAEESVLHWIKKFIIMDDVKLHIATNDYDMIQVHGPQSLQFISSFSGNSLIHLPLHHCTISTIESSKVYILRVPALSELCYTLIYSSFDISIDKFFETQNDIPFLEDNQYWIMRLEAGMGTYNNEYSLMYNPLEAGLLHLINFKKGCYIGQEVIARLDSYNKVNKRLIGIKSEYPIIKNSVIIHDDKETGIITTSCFSDTHGHIALAYIRSEYAFQNDTISFELEKQPYSGIINLLPFSDES